MLIWLAMEVKLNGTSRMWVAASKEGEEVSECCVLFVEERASLQLLPQGMSPTVAVDPVHGCEHCDFISHTLQYPGFPTC